ncbi:pfEMP1 [Plasmodium falciparum HB3]|uniref:PfEMP1 n=1 Tax=Plasmodium falciparum (isolate HB3) TaxID=137071 RepID=A0A0L7KMR9_PLAFX|nr:pfEMP1 [Plasmodium falciparum HB3]
MDKLIEHEEKDAKQCIEKHTCPPPEDTSRGRSLPPAGAGDDEDEDDEEDDEEEEVENHTEEEPHDHDAECKCHENVPTSPPDACEIADAILTREGATNYIDVCKQKYDGGKKSYPGWNCNSKTFFAWHKFKKDKEKKEQDLGGFASFDNEDTLPQPDDELNGEICV